MAELQTSTDPVIAKLGAAIFGAVVSLRFVQGTPLERFLMVCGGAALSYYASTPIAAYLGVADAEGLIGFLLGLFGMAIAAKLYEGIQATDPKAVIAELWDRLLKRLGI